MADENYYQGPTIDKGIVMSNSSGGDERLQGLTSMKPLSAAGGTLTARASVNSSAVKITPDLSAKLRGLTPALAQGIRDVVRRK